MNKPKPRLILVQSTDSPVKEHIAKGIWDRQTFSLSQYARDFEVWYYTCDNKNYQEIMPPGVTHKTGPSSEIFGLRHVLYYFFLLRSASDWKKMKNIAVRIIGVNVPVVPMLKKIAGKKLLMSYQFDWANGMKKDYKGIKPMVSAKVQRDVIGAADHLLCTTQWLADIARERYGKEKITIIPNYVNTEVFKPAAAKKKQVVFAGRLHWSKGIDTLVEAFKKFSAEKPEYKLIIMGIGEESLKLQALAKGANIEFTGGVSNMTVAQNFNESEIFVLPTVNMEGHPKALVEAMAAGCKCVTSDVPGNNNVLIDAHTPQFLFKSQDAEDLYRKLLAATEYTGDEQYRFALSNYSAAICFDKELAILGALVQ